MPPTRRPKSVLAIPIVLRIDQLSSKYGSGATEAIPLRGFQRNSVRFPKLEIQDGMSSREGHTLLIMLFHKLIKIEVILLVFRRDTSLSLFLVPSTGGTGLLSRKSRTTPACGERSNSSVGFTEPQYIRNRRTSPGSGQSRAMVTQRQAPYAACGPLSSITEG